MTAYCVSRLHFQSSATMRISIHGTCLPVNRDRAGLQCEILLTPVSNSLRRLRLAPLSTRLRLWYFAPQRNLRLPFRLIRTGIFTPSYGRRTVASRHHPPTHRGLMNARCLARGTRFIYRRGQECCRLRLSSPPGMCLSQWLLTAHSVSRLPPQHRRLRASLFTGRASL